MPRCGATLPKCGQLFSFHLELSHEIQGEILRKGFWFKEFYTGVAKDAVFEFEFELGAIFYTDEKEFIDHHGPAELQRSECS